MKNELAQIEKQLNELTDKVATIALDVLKSESFESYGDLANATHLLGQALKRLAQAKNKVQ